MRVMAVHDKHGSIVAVTTYPRESPSASIAAGPGQMVSELELRELDTSRRASEQDVIAMLRRLRVDIKIDAKVQSQNDKRAG